MIKPIRKPKCRRENAQTMVEFALVFPILLLITYGIIEFGRLVFIYAAVTNAAREGARYGAAVRTVGSLPQYADCSGIETAARSKALLTNVTSVTISLLKGLTSAPVAYTCAQVQANPGIIGSGDRIRVTVVAHYMPWIAFVRLNGFDISSTNFRTVLVNITVDPSP